MKVIDLLNKIANGEDVLIKIKYKNIILSYRTDIKDYAGDNYFLSDLIGNENIGLILNDEVEIIEEEKKIPEKLFHCCMETDNEEIKVLIQNINSLSDRYNQLIDYLKSKGDE